MPFGPGKYGANAEELLRKIGGQMCAVMIVDGPQGPGFDVATTNPVHLARLPTLLRLMADDIEKSLGVQQH